MAHVTRQTRVEGGGEVKGRKSDIEGEDHAPRVRMKMIVFVCLLMGMPFMSGN